MNLFIKKSKIALIVLVGLLFSYFELAAQSVGTQSPNANLLELVSDTSGYIDFSQDDINNNEVIPTIKGELTVTEQGQATYNIPIEVFKGVNDFQPNLALAYNSQSGDGQVGIGWNLVGLSSITIGGKSKRIDGSNEGVQYNDDDPFYLDGQRLIEVDANQYVTEQYNQIKVTKTDQYTFKVQYTDGKVAIYKYKVKGQYLIDNIQDAFNNKIFYAYTVTTGVPYISTIKYGGSSAANSPFTISFTYLNRLAPLKIYRKGEVIVSSKFLKNIVISSTVGTHRKYNLYHDHTSTKAERLRKVEVENGDGDKLKPLNFNYNLESGNIQVQVSYRSASGFNSTTKHLGNVAYGDFEGNGDLTAVYVTNTSPNYFTPGVTSQYSIMSSKYGEIETGADLYYNTQKLFSGRIKESNGKFSTEDKLLQIKTDPNVFNYTVSSIGGYIMNRKYNINARTINESNSQINSQYSLALGYDFLKTRPGHAGEPWEGTKLGDRLRVIESSYFELAQDFNGDGLIDRILFVPPAYASKTQFDWLNHTLLDVNVEESFRSSKTPSKIYFYEVGKNINSATITPITTDNINFDKDSEAYPIEFTGDMIPEIMIVNRNTKQYSIYKIHNGQLQPLITNQTLNNFDKKTPLIFGDFNGDGLTDFITPNKLYSIENSDVNSLVNTINSPQEQHKWQQYINTGAGFSVNERDFKNQKLAYCVPSQRPIIVEDKSAAFWKNLWGGAQYTVNDVEYAACGVAAVDYNNDGRTDLVSYTKFGVMTYTDLLKDSKVKSNINPTTGTSFANKIRLIENLPNNTANIEFDLTVNSHNSIPLDDIKISALSLLVNTTESRGIEASKSILKFIDPVQRQEIRFDINNTEFLENQIQEINNGSGIKQKIEYASASTIVRNGNLVTSSLYYNADQAALGSLEYPYYINKHQPNYLLVKRINTIMDGTAVSKEYRYENAVQNFDGKGFLGFMKTKVSDPYESKKINGEYLPARPFEGVLWTIKTRNPIVDNAVVKTEYGSLDGVDILTLHEKIITKYDRGLRYIILENSSVAHDYLKQLTVSKSYSYRGSDLLLQNVFTNHNSEYITQTNFDYKPSFTSGDHFYHGKINLNQESITKGGQTFTTKDEYDFFATNGAPKIHKKYGNNTDPLITEYTYFANGNLRTEKISGTGIAPLTTTYGYETTNRYVNKITTPDGMISQYEYKVDFSGELEKETSPLGLVTRYDYDTWGNKINVIDFLGLHTNLIKEQTQEGGYTLSTEKEGSPTTIVTFDVFDRPVKTKTQSINGKWLVAETIYDVYGKKIKESEPYFEDTPNILWNEFEYDALDRMILLKDYTGKETTTCYEGMTVTVEDGDKKTSKTLDVMGNVIKHVDMGGEVIYDYYPNGTLKEADYDGIAISISQDGWGNKTRLEDPSAGVYTYTYDILGRQLTEVTPKGQTTYIYDNFGKLLTETSTGDETNITANYEYDLTTKLPKKITGSNGTNTFIYETIYDQYYRIKGKKETLTGAFVYQTDSEFDAYGRLKTTELKTTVTNINKTTTSKIENLYETGSGILIEQKDVTANRRIWKINEVNQKGQTKKLIYGNNFLLTNEYDDYFLPTKIKDQNNFTNQTALEIDYIFDSQKRRLNSRNIHVFNAFEKFDYDDLDRLILEKVNNIVTNQYTYDVRGRMTYNNEVGTYEYGNSNYQIEKFKFNAQGQTLMNNRGVHQLKFNAFKQATEIYLPGHDRINYGFNLFKKRAIAYYGSEAVNPASRPIRKYYTSDNAVEIVFNSTTNKTDITTYVDGDPYSSSYIKVDKFTGTTLDSSTNYFLHRDYQGSILALSNISGRVVEQRYFDAWGNIKLVNHITWNGSTSTAIANTTLGIIDRGYTGHEHLQSVGLIHMNGRLYDPVIRRFLSPDNFVQDPYNTQNFDRYTYVYNNPLIYTDSSGESIELGVAVLISVAVSILSTGIDNLINGVPFWYGMGKSAVMGAVSGAISFGIGTAANTITSTAGKMAFQGAAHGISGGIMSDLQGGDFDSGFLSGAISSLVSSNVINKAQAKGWSANKTAAVTIAAGGLSGGISSTIAGGNFWSGARQGLITSGLNHVAHSGINFGDSLDDKAKQLFGKDYKEKFGVSELKLGSSLGEKGITAENGTTYTFDKKSEFILANNKEPIGGITLKSSRTIYISDFIFKHSVEFFQVTLGHELIHSYHYMRGMNNLSNSEYSAYQYSIDFYDAQGWETSELYNIQKQFKLNTSYDYQNIPGFPIP